MPPQFFVKFQYKDKIKKICISLNDFNWDNLSSILSRSFFLSKQKLKLTYKDTEGDEITVCCDDDLIEAYKTCSSTLPLRFFIYECEINSSQEKSLNGTQKNLLTSSENGCLQLGESKPKEESSMKRSSFQGKSCEFDKKGQVSIQDDKVNLSTSVVKLDPNELNQILQEILFTTSSKQKIRALKNSVTTNRENSSRVVIEVDIDKVGETLINIIQKILSETTSCDNLENASLMENNAIPSSIKEFSLKNNNRSEENGNILSQKTPVSDNLFNISLKESIYENSYLSSIRDTKMADSKDKSFIGTSMSFCRDLSSTYGVKLTTKLENGKLKLLSVPASEYSIIESAKNS